MNKDSLALDTKNRSSVVITNVTRDLHAQASRAFVSLNNKLDKVHTSASTALGAVDGSQVSMSLFRETLSELINTEAIALPVLQGQFENTIADVRTQFLLTLNADSVDRSAILSEDSTYLTGINYQITDLVNSFVNQEQYRAATKAGNLTTSLSSATYQNRADLSKAIYAEKSRASASVHLALIDTLLTSPISDGALTDNLEWWVCIILKAYVLL